MRFHFPSLLIALGLATAILPCASAGADAYDPIASGQTTIAFARPFLSTLAAHGAKIEVKAGAKRKGAKAVLPAAGGEFDPALGAGTVESEGTIVFVAGKRRVPFRRIVFKAKRSPLFAKVGGSQLKIASGATLHPTRAGFGERFLAGRLRLTAKVASRLNKKLRLGQALSAGTPLGAVEATVQPATVHLIPQGRLSLALDPAFAAKLNELFVSLNPIAPAELAPGPTLSFPVGLESTLAPDAAAGVVKLGGAVELLQLGNAQVFWREVWLEPGAASLAAEADIEPSPPQVGKQPQGPLLSLPPGASVTADPSSRTIGISGQNATLTAATAESLNAAFAPGSSTFAAGETIGTLSLASQAE